MERVSSDGVVIAGVSTRAFAESAWRAGFACETVDAFGDLDQKARVHNVSFHRDLRRPYGAAAAAAVSRRFGSGAAAYVANFENQPEAVRRLAEGRILLGNAPDVLACSRDPFRLADIVAAAGARAPITLRRYDAWRADASRPWLRKPIRGGGGSGVRPWQPGTPLRRHEIAQELIDGVPASMVFLADGRRAVVIGLCRQLTRPATIGASGALDAPAYRYAGSLFPLCAPTLDSDDDAAVSTSIEERAAAIATAVTAAFGLRGINGIDFVLHAGELFVLELNPRYPASAELIERATGRSMFQAHVEACVGRIPMASVPWRKLSAPRERGCARSAKRGDEGLTARIRGGATRRCRLQRPSKAQDLPPRDTSPDSSCVWGKAILYARRDIIIRATCSLLDDHTFRDIPFPGEWIRRGQPICTIFADGTSHAACHERLADASLVVERLLGSTNSA